MLSRVQDATLFSDGSIAVVDGGSQEIRIFHSDGSVKAVAGRKGEGPGEFTLLTSVREFGAGGVLGYDRHLRRATFLDLKGRFLSDETVHVPPDWGSPELLAITEAGFLLRTSVENESRVLAPGFTEEQKHLRVAWMDDSEELEVLIVVQGTHQMTAMADGHMILGSVPFGSKSLVATGSGKSIVGNSQDPSLAVIDLGSLDVKQVQLQIPRRELTDREWREARRFRMQTSNSSKRAVELYWEKAPRPELIPYADRLLIDQRDRIWAREFSFDDSKNEWNVFSMEGALLGRGSFPPDHQILEVGDGYVLSLRKDALDVPRVEKWRLVN